MQPHALETVVGYVSSVAESAAFYERLGFRIHRESSDYALVELGATTLKLHQEDAETLEEFQIASAVRPRGASLYFYFEVPDIDSWFADHRDATSYSAPRERPWGKREVLVIDPDGYNSIFYS